MVVSVRRIVKWVQMIILISLFSFILFKVIDMVHVWMQPVDKYQEPKGNSLKVNSDMGVEQVESEWAGYMLQRLKLFYITGE